MGHRALVIGAHGPEVEPALAWREQRRVGRQQDFANRVRGAMIQPARHTVPERAEVLRVAAADVLTPS